MEQRLEMVFLKENVQAIIVFQMVIVTFVGLFLGMQKGVLSLQRHLFVMPTQQLTEFNFSSSPWPQKKSANVYLVKNLVMIFVAYY